MKKIPTLFVRNRERHLVSPAVTPGCEWVLEGEGRPTRKVDGTAVLLRDGTAYKRRTIKPGKTAPAGFEEADHDPATGKRFGWMRSIRPPRKTNCMSKQSADSRRTGGTREAKPGRTNWSGRRCRETPRAWLGTLSCVTTQRPSA